MQTSEFVDEKIYGGWRDDAWSNNQLSSVSLASSSNKTGPVLRGNVINEIAYPWPLALWGGSCW